MENINYVNAVMTEINDLTDCIYESLVDSDYKEMKSNIQNLIRVLRDLERTHEDIPEQSN
jgi:flagellin-specific chaperone FliS